MFTDKLWQGLSASLAVALIAVGGWGVLQHQAFLRSQTALAAQKSSWDEERGASKIALSNLQERFNKLSLERTEDARLNDQKVKDEKDKTAVALAAGVALRDRLRSATKDYATLFAQRGAEATPVPGSAEYSSAVSGLEFRAQALGGLLERCDALSERLANDAENLATQVRGLQAAYRSLEKK